ncbi:Protein CBG27700 [Anopheles sinensis]|uniref:Protein CBG27700 n=1 Tax=Anopheles sinensis TaxID=74873 RepID=A0A084WUB9_ANOSI|nr:Protein CBG27700 [Anopheles sinensis]
MPQCHGRVVEKNHPGGVTRVATETGPSVYPTPPCLVECRIRLEVVCTIDDHSLSPWKRYKSNGELNSNNYQHKRHDGPAVQLAHLSSTSPVG